MKKMKLTKQGIEKFEKMIKEKEEELRKLRQEKGYAAEVGGDAWHDNFAFEQAEIQERALIRQISDLRMQINTAELIESIDDVDKVQIGSKVTILMEDSEGAEEISFILESVGNMETSVVSVNSPLGECIFEKKVGYEGCYYVNENQIKVKILSIEK